MPCNIFQIERSKRKTQTVIELPIVKENKSFDLKTKSQKINCMLKWLKLTDAQISNILPGEYRIQKKDLLPDLNLQHFLEKSVNIVQRFTKFFHKRMLYIF